MDLGTPKQTEAKQNADETTPETEQNVNEGKQNVKDGELQDDETKQKDDDETKQKVETNTYVDEMGRACLTKEELIASGRTLKDPTAADGEGANVRQTHTIFYRLHPELHGVPDASWHEFKPWSCPCPSGEPAGTW